MHLLSVLLFVLVCVQNPELNAAESIENDVIEIKSQQNLENYHTSVVLIDIVFTDMSKRTCTGSIIHENVVITAAHCFRAENNTQAIPELALSFIIFGTKEMFDTVHEHYLPIERIITHPDFSEWTADLSLVYTFADMTSNKPGTVIPLAGERLPYHVGSNVTVLTWGVLQGEVDEVDNLKFGYEDFIGDIMKETPVPSETYAELHIMDETSKNDETMVTAMLEHDIQSRANSEIPSNQVKQKTQNKLMALLESQNPNQISQYLSGVKRVTTMEPVSLQTNDELIKDEEIATTKNPETLRNDADFIYDENVTKPNKARFRRSHAVTQLNPVRHNLKSKNLRIQTELKGPYLTLEIFQLTYVKTCKIYMQEAKSRHVINPLNDEFLCYNAQDHFITDESAGAPAIRRGRLVAVTVGSVKGDGEHVAVGMKISCYCAWIASHLPSGGNLIDCCENCCEARPRVIAGQKYKNFN